MIRTVRLTPFLALAPLACGSSKARPPCTPATGPDEDGCGAFFCAGDLESDWVTTQAATGFCTATPPATANELYASCQTLNGGSIASSCAGMVVGQQYCDGGLLTSLCLQDSDCPGGTRCDPGQVVSADQVSFGFCEKTCTLPGNAECGTCFRDCDSTKLCVSPGPGYPTNTPCDATHPAIDIMAAFDGTPVGGPGTLTLTLPGISPIVLDSSWPFGIPVVLPYPPGATAGPASVSFVTTPGGLYTFSGETNFQADPTMCTMVTLDLTMTGFPDAGP